MKLTIFGSTGKTGIHLVRKALEAGHIVTAFARSPEKITLSHSNLTVVEGNTLDRDAVADAVEGAEAILSLIGVNPKSEEFTFYKSISNILSSMKQHSIKRLVMSAGAGVGDPNDKAGIMGNLMGGIIKLIARNAYEDGIKTANLVRSTSEIDWTIVRVPMLNDSPGAVKQIKIGYLGKGTGPKLSREDMAQFILNEVTANEFIGQAPVISN